MYRLGDITAEDINTVFSTIEKLVQRMSDLEAKARNPSPTDSLLWFPAQIIASEPIADQPNRHRYSWKRCTFNAATSSVVFEPSDIHPSSWVGGNQFARAALNGGDNGHTPTGTIIAPGINIAGPAYPAGFAPIPVAGFPVVTMFMIRNMPSGDNEGRSIYWFSWPMAHDGTCEAGTPQQQQTFISRIMSGLGIRRAG